ncbi:sugar phosphate isomerase/epimerase [Paenibacillus sp. J2TS4]|uniref:sugar phosphate isomerase/epimerase family protein n=1 Tax=Paenibacillus sp. J2TS4 TaxID=2807194 RepID=UPI001B1D7DFE|nr:sugar phosphate isomerase/epimerase [Paenibacillus sp. J2TS4]GIP33300.1 hypothetical protein J2TS4_25100 [Paenibacillus sp. J2TS4]
MVKLACMTLPFANYSLERALEGMARAGYRYLSFGLPHAGMEVPDESDPASVERLSRLFEQYRLEPVNLISTNQLAPGQTLERARIRFETARALGVKELLSLGTWGYRQFPDVPVPEEELARLNERFVSRFQEIAELAERYRILVTIKPHTGNTATAAHMKQTLEAIGSEYIQGSYDPGNVHYYEGIRAEEDMPLIADRLQSFIVKDHRGARSNLDFPIPGDGEVRFVELFGQLKQSGFTGPVIVERVDGTADRPWLPEEVEERLYQTRVRIEQWLKAAGLSIHSPEP